MNTSSAAHACFMCIHAVTSKTSKSNGSQEATHRNLEYTSNIATSEKLTSIILLEGLSPNQKVKKKSCHAIP